MTPLPATATVSIPLVRIVTESELDDGSRVQIVGSATFRTTTRGTGASPTHQELEGEPVRGESDVLQVCKVLRSALAAIGIAVSKFRQPMGVEEGVDAIADSSDGEVRVQVVGVLPQHHLAELGRTGSSTSARTPDERAADVCAAIERKTASYPLKAREDVIFAVDSIRSFEHVQAEVLAVLAQPPAQSIVASSGFRSVWLVGPVPVHAHRLA